MRKDELANKINSLEKEIEKFKTSQRLGTGSGVLIPVATINETFSGLSHRYPSLVLVFTSEDTLRPIITPYVSGSLDGVENDNVVISYDAQSLSMGSGDYSPSNPKQTMCNIYVESDYGISGNLVITGMVYANCRGVLRSYRYV